MKKSVISTVLISLAVIFLLFAFSASAINDKATAYNEGSLLGDIGVDILLVSPGREQVANGLVEEFTKIASLEPYYLFSCDIKIGNLSKTEDVVIFDDFSDLDNTPYSSSRIIKGEINSESNSIIIDHNAARRYGLDVGDAIWIGFGRNGDGETFTVCAISENNLIMSDKGSFAIQYAGKQKALVESVRPDGVNYSGVYVRAKADCKEALLTELKDGYMPMALAPKENDYELEPEYYMAMKEFEATDHSYLVEDVAADADTDLIAGSDKAAASKILVLSALTVVVVLVISALLTFSKRRIIRNAMQQKSFIRVCLEYAPVLRIIFNIIAGCGAIVFAALICANNADIYYSAGDSVFLLLPTLISYCIAVAVSYLTDIAILYAWRVKR